MARRHSIAVAAVYTIIWASSLGHNEDIQVSAISKQSGPPTTCYSVEMLLDSPLANGTTVYFCSHTLIVYRLLNFINLQDISFVGLNETKLDCIGTNGFQFKNVVNLKVENLTFFNCAVRYEMVIDHKGTLPYLFSSGLHIVDSVNIYFANVDISNSSGVGLSMFQTGGRNMFVGSNFTQNGKDEVRGGTGILIEMTDINQTEGKSVCSSMYSFTRCIFRKNIAYETDRKSTPFGRGAGLRMYLRNNASNNIIIIEKCKFHDNVASKFGGGLFISVHNMAFNNSIVISNSKFTRNISPDGSGGASFVGFPCSEDCLNNSFLFRNCSFRSNVAKYGGASSFTSTRVFNSSISVSLYNKLKYHSCTWLNNSGNYGSAISILPDKWSLTSVGSFPTPVFENCTLTSNFIHHLDGAELEKPYKQIYHGVGAVYCLLIGIELIGNFTASNNNGSALFINSGSLHVATSAVVSFINNTGYSGGAVHLLGYSTININENTTFIFKNNQAETDGGAIYYRSSDSLEYAYSYNCFISKTNGKIANVTFSFFGNYAGSGLQPTKGYGYSIYASSLLPCARKYENSSMGDYSFLDKIATFNFSDQKMEDAIGTDLHSFFVNSTDSFFLPVIPGKLTDLQFAGLDDFLRLRKEVLKVTLKKDRNSSVEVDYYKPYISSSEITLYGKPEDTATILLSTIYQDKTALMIKVKLESCPPGYVFLHKFCLCSSHSNYSIYSGIRQCNNLIFQAARKTGYWYGYIKGKDANESSFVTTYCPNGYCDFTTGRYLPATSCRIKMSRLICQLSRTGILCSKCRNNFSVYHHSPKFKCGKEDFCKYGFLFYILSDILPVTLVFFIIITCNISFTSGIASGFIFYAQIIEFFKISAHDSIHMSLRISTAHRVINMLYKMFNLQFFVIDELSFCLWKTKISLNIIAFQYVSLFFSLGLVLLVIFALRLCDVRKIKLLFKLRVHVIQPSVIHGLSAFLVLCFAQCAKTSVYLLNYQYLQGKGKVSLETVSYFYGEYKYFGQEHLKYAIPAFFMLVTFVILPLLVLLSYPLCYKLFSLLRINDTKFVYIMCRIVPIEKLKPFLDSFQGCFKDNCRCFSGLYFLYRILILTNLAFSYIKEFYFFLEIQLIIMFLIHSLAMPYKEQSHNMIDSFLIANMAIINGITIYNFNVASLLGKSEYHYFALASSIQVVLKALPLLCALLYCGYRITKKFIQCCKRQSVDSDTLVDFSVPYPQ